jgi:hypothetical protein
MSTPKPTGRRKIAAALLILCALEGSAPIGPALTPSPTPEQDDRGGMQRGRRLSR